MLVLAREVGDEIVVNHNIAVKIVSIDGTTVRLGIDAPETVTVDRKEVHDRRSEFVIPWELEVVA
jgi:carbon storage regulator